MIAYYEKRIYEDKTSIWCGTYVNLVNRPHWHTDYEILMIREGTADVFVDHQVFHLKENDTIFIVSKEIHYIRSTDSLISMIICEKRVLDYLFESGHLSSPLLRDSYGFITVFDKMKAELESKGKLYDQLIKSLLREYVINIIRNEKTEKANSIISYKDNNYYSLLSDIDENYSTYSFEKAYEHMNMNKSYFSRYFKEKTGITFSTYLNTVRVEKAILMRRENPSLSITTISMSVGFDTIRNFNRVFKEIVGYTPKQLPSDYEFVNIHQSDDARSMDPTESSSVLLRNKSK